MPLFKISDYLSKWETWTDLWFGRMSLLNLLFLFSFIICFQIIEFYVNQVLISNKNYLMILLMSCLKNININLKKQ